MDAAKLDAYLAEHYPGQKFPGIHNDGRGSIEIVDWPEELGKAPTPEEIDAYEPPTPPDPIDHQAEVEEALAVAKSGPTVAKTLSVVERLVARVAYLEEFLGL